MSMKILAPLPSRGELMGIGISSFTEIVGAGPSKDFDILGIKMFDSAEIRVHPTSRAIARFGTKSQGKGHETTYAKIVAEELGIPASDIAVEGESSRSRARRRNRRPSRRSPSPPLRYCHPTSWLAFLTFEALPSRWLVSPANNEWWFGRLTTFCWGLAMARKKPKKTPAPQLADVLAGLPIGSVDQIADFFKVPSHQAAALLGIPARILYSRKLRGDRLSRDESDRVASVTTLILLATETFGPDVDVIWFSMPHPVLDGEKPIGHLQTEAGRRLVERALRGNPQPGFVHQRKGSVTSEAPRSASLGGEECGHPKALISYAWESDAHKLWVRGLAAELRHRGVDVILDQWQVHPGDQLPSFMEQAVRDSDFVVIIGTPSYKAKSEGRSGGVGYEGNIMTAELFARNNQRKFIPALRAGDHQSALPTWLAGKSTIDLRGDSHGTEFDELVMTLRGEREGPPPLGPAPRRRPARERSASASISRSQDDPIRDARPKPEVKAESKQPIRILGVVEQEIGVPRTDGSRGSGLYKVAFRLSETPPHEWGDLFVQIWDLPPRSTTMHRPGIARVVGDRIILDGTTIDEVARYHRDTLKLVIEEVNKRFEEMEREHRKREEAEQSRVRDHQESTRRTAREIKFE